MILSKQDILGFYMDAIFELDKTQDLPRTGDYYGVPGFIFHYVKTKVLQVITKCEIQKQVFQYDASHGDTYNFFMTQEQVAEVYGKACRNPQDIPLPHACMYQMQDPVIMTFTVKSSTPEEVFYYLWKDIQYICATQKQPTVLSEIGQSMYQRMRG